MEEHLLASIRQSDPSLTKLHLVFEPSAYFTDENFDAFLDLLRNNTQITYVLLERRLARALPKTQYEELLRALFAIPNLQEAELWSQRLSWPVLWSALQSARRLRRLGLGLVTLTDVASINEEAMLPHGSLEVFYLSDFKLLPASETEKEPKLDPILATLGSCEKLQRVEIFSFAMDHSACTSVWPLLKAPSLSQVTLRRLHLSAAAVTSPSDDTILCPLRSLDVSENPLKDEGCTSVLRRVCRTKWRTTLGELNLKKTNCSTGLATNLLEEFSVENDVPLALEKISLAANTLRDDTAKALAHLLEQPAFKLKQLDLYRCCITNVGMHALAEAMRQNTHLRSLGLAYNDFDDEAYVSFGSALARDNRTLESINLQVDRKRLHKKGAMALQEMCRQNTTLKYVGTLLDTVVPHAHAKYGNSIRMCLRLNKAGRVKVESNTATLEEWMQLLAVVSDDLFAIHFMVRTYPQYAALAANQHRAT